MFLSQEGREEVAKDVPSSALAFHEARGGDLDEDGSSEKGKYTSYAARMRSVLSLYAWISHRWSRRCGLERPQTKLNISAHSIDELMNQKM